MSCGCCIVGSQGMPVAEVINHNVEGLLVPIDSPKLLSDSIISLLDDPVMRSRFSENARKKSLQWEQKLTLENLYKFLLGMKK